MQGKPPVLLSYPLTAAVDKLSKAFLMDMVVDRVRAEIGEDATDDQVLTKINDWVRPVRAVRNEKPIVLAIPEWAIKEQQRRQDVINLADHVEKLMEGE